MLRACTTFLYVLTADAARSNLKMERASAIEQVMNTVDSLLQGGNAGNKLMNNLRQLAVHSETPGVLGEGNALNTALEAVILDIEQNVETTIIAGHNAAQVAVDTTILAVETASNTAAGQKVTANAADLEWYQCVGVEKTKWVNIETAVANKAQAEADQVAPCAAEVAAEPYTYALLLDNFACDISEGDCDTKLAAYEANVLNVRLVSMRLDLGTDRGVYNTAVGLCSTANGVVSTSGVTLGTANAEYAQQQLTCLGLHGTRALDMCTFGSTLQSKCLEFDEHKAQVADIDGTGTEFSTPDRVAEWTTTSKVKCLLRKIIAGEAINDEASAECDEAVNYDVDVGVIDKHAERLATTMTPAKFTCEETAFEFSNGLEWTVSEASVLSATPAADDYTTQIYKPAFQSDQNLQPFQACVVSATEVEEEVSLPAAEDDVVDPAAAAELPA